MEQVAKVCERRKNKDEATTAAPATDAKPKSNTDELIECASKVDANMGQKLKDILNWNKEQLHAKIEEEIKCEEGILG